MAAEFALKAHIVFTNPELAPDMSESVEQVQQIAESVDLTEAPEDAICSLAVDLMHYCEREKIDWAEEVIARASKRFRAEQAGRI